MKTTAKVNVAALKAQLSSYLRRVQAGQRYTVFDRKEPVAELMPVSSSDNIDGSLRELIATGLITKGSGDFSSIKISPLKNEKRVDVTALLDFVRGD